MAKHENVSLRAYFCSNLGGILITSGRALPIPQEAAHPSRTEHPQMKSRLMRTSLALSTLLATAASARGEDAAIEAEFKKLDGEWTAPAMAGGDVVYRFKGKKLEIDAPSRSYKMTITLGPKAKP